MRFRELLEDPNRPLSKAEFSQFIKVVERVLVTLKNKQLNEADINANPAMLTKDQVAALKGLISLPDLSQNKSNGNAYEQMRFMLAMAGAPDYPTPPSGAMAGDPAMIPYSSADMEIIKSAIDMIGGGRIIPVTDGKSKERDDTNTVSPVANWMKSSKPKKVEPKVLK